MEYRFLGASGFKVPVLGFGTGTFGGKGPLFSAWGNTEVDEEAGAASENPKSVSEGFLFSASGEIIKLGVAM